MTNNTITSQLNKLCHHDSFERDDSEMQALEYGVTKYFKTQLSSFSTKSSLSPFSFHFIFYTCNAASLLPITRVATRFLPASVHRSVGNLWGLLPLDFLVPCFVSLYFTHALHHLAFVFFLLTHLTENVTLQFLPDYSQLLSSTFAHSWVVFHWVCNPISWLAHLVFSDILVD